MRKKTIVSLAFAGLAAGGCYTAFDYDRDGDGGADTAVDPGVDTGHDTAVDPGVDTDGDTTIDTWDDPIMDRGPTDGPAWCPEPFPAPGGPTLSWWVDDPSSFGEVRIIDLGCMVGIVNASGMGLDIELECVDPSSGSTALHTIHIESSTWMGTLLYPGMPVSFSYVADPIWWIDRFMRLSAGVGGTILAATDASNLLPPLEPSSGWYSPLAIDPISGVCPGMSTGCGLEERLALRVTTGDTELRVFDSSVGWAGMMGAYQVIVDRATMYDEIWCTDTPQYWFSVVIAAQSDG